MNIFVICSVRDADEKTRKELEDYKKSLEDSGHNVHLPHLDTRQNVSGFKVCEQNYKAIKWADRVDIFYNSYSKGTHFDLGMAFALNKEIHIVKNEEYGPGKSFGRMIDEWVENNSNYKYEILSFYDDKNRLRNSTYSTYFPDYRIAVVERTSKAPSKIIYLNSYITHNGEKKKIIDMKEDEKCKDILIVFSNGSTEYLNNL